jgi:cyclic pyranopterin phosphate synthase
MRELQSQTEIPHTDEKTIAAGPALDRFARPVHDLRISLTDQCSLRCSYCMPAEVFDGGYDFLTKSQLVRFRELDRIVAAFLRCGVRKVRITGGEPLVRPGVVKFLTGLKRFPGLEDVAMTTNGLRLKALADRLRNTGLRRITVSLDAMDDQLFGHMNGRGRNVAEVIAGIDAAEAAGFPLKINMVVQRGLNESQILPMARYFKRRGIPLRFIEFMDAGNHNHWHAADVVSGQEILKILRTEFELEPVDSNYRGEVAKRYRFMDDRSEIGLITSVSLPFCGDCSRARLSADGKLFTCLFATQGIDIVDRMRRENLDDEALFRLIRNVWIAREDRYSELRSRQPRTEHKIEMSYIGG